MSGVPRCWPTTPATESWYDGRVKTVDTPPPVARALGSGSPEKALFRASLVLSFPPRSAWVRWPVDSRDSWVPPTAVTSGSEAGQSTARWVYSSVPAALESSVAPASPVAASTVTWFLSALKYALRSARIEAALGKVGSVAPKLWLITWPR